MKLKTILCTLSVALLFTFSTAFSMDPEQSPTFKKSSITLNDQIIGTKIQDLAPESISNSYVKENQNAEHIRRRILSLDGGGMRGIHSAAVLAVIEQIINLPINTQALGRPKSCGNNGYLELSDIFEVVCGASTGSIIAASLVNAEPVSRAADILRLYVNYGYKIFDETARWTGSLFDTKYGPEGLKNTLIQCAGGNNSKTLRESVKEGNHLYITACNTEENRGTTVVFSNAQQVILSDSYIDYGPEILLDVVMGSCAAPTYFPPVKIKESYYIDGGIGAKLPARLAYEKELLIYTECHFDIISLGTGLERPDQSDQSKNEGGNGILTGGVQRLISELLAVPTNNDVKSCVDIVKNTSSPLQSFFRLEPILEKGGWDIMDNTTLPYALSLIHKAFQLTQGEVFKNMIEYLGFTMPDEEEMKSVHREVLRQLYALSSDDYLKLTDFEKELLVKRILQLDFDFYEKCNVKNIDLTTEQKNTLLEQLVVDIEKIEGNSGYLHRLKDWLYPDKNYQLIEIIRRSLDFHKNSKNVGKLTLEVLKSIEHLDKEGQKKFFEAWYWNLKASEVGRPILRLLPVR